MNETPESRSDGTPGFDPLESSRQREALERRLRSIRPRPARIDLAAVVARIRPLEPTPAGSQRRRRRDRLAIIVTTAWISGALAGAVAMFAFTANRAAQPNGDPTADFRLPADALPRGAPAAQVPPSEAGPRDTDGQLPGLLASLETESALLRAPFGNDHPPGWSEGPTLRGGMRIHEYLTASSLPVSVEPTVPSNSNATQPPAPRSLQDTKPGREPDWRGSLDQLLRELVGEPRTFES